MAVRSTAHASTDSDSDQDHSSATSKAGSGSDVDPGPPGLAGATGEGNSSGRRRSAGWAFHGLKGPWSRAPGSPPVTPAITAAPAAVLAKHSSTTLAITGLWHWWEELAVSGWAATRVGAAQQGSRPLAVGLTLSSYPDGAGDAWAISLSRQRLECSSAWAGRHAELTMELSTQRAVADGITFTPGLVFAQGPDCSLLSLCCRSEWLF